MKWGSRAEVLEPRELREWARGEVEGMVKRYKELGSEAGIEKMERVWAGRNN